jgi:DNA-binding protein YbaB
MTVFDPGAMRFLPEEFTDAMGRIRAATETLHGESFTGTDRSGLVAATVTGAGGLTAIDLHPTAPRRLDTESLGDAVADAIGAAEDARKRRHGELFAGLQVAGIGVGDFVAHPESFVPEPPR